MTHWAEAGHDTPVGRIVLRAEDGRITQLDWSAAPDSGADPVLDAARHQLDAYFAGTRQRFTLPLAPLSTPFQHLLLEALMAIPFGETRTYGEIARMLDEPSEAQAVGQACGANPIPILIPCHRVLGAGGLGGYSGAGGIETKVALLRHEGAASLLI